MKMKNILAIVALQVLSTAAMADCVVVNGGKESPFDGSTLPKSVDKKSVSTIKEKYPDLNILQKMASGGITPTADCAAAGSDCLTCK